LERIKNILLNSGKNISEKQADMFVAYAQMLAEYNKKMNLTAITEPEDIAVKHFLDSISPLWVTDIKGRAADVGTGAGFPAIPIKIMCPEIKMTLIDSLAKRIGFLSEVCKELMFSDVELIHTRAEDAGRDKKLRERFDVCLSRAVANMASLSELCIPFVKEGGKFAALKGPLASEEIDKAKKAVSVLGGEIDNIFEVDIPFSDLRHKIVIIKKVRHTPETYPRKAPVPIKNPI